MTTVTTWLDLTVNDITKHHWYYKVITPLTTKSFLFNRLPFVGQKKSMGKYMTAWYFPWPSLEKKSMKFSQFLWLENCSRKCQAFAEEALSSALNEVVRCMRFSQPDKEICSQGGIRRSSISAANANNVQSHQATNGANSYQSAQCADGHVALLGDVQGNQMKRQNQEKIA